MSTVNLKKINSLNKQLHLIKCREDINTFIEYVMKDNKNQPVTQGEIHLYWNWFIDTCIANGQKRIGVLAPMEHGKTCNITIARVLHRIGKNPGIRIKLLSCVDKKAIEKANAIKRIIEYSEEYQEVFPNVKKNPGDWSKHSFTVERDAFGMVDSTVDSQGVTSGGVGGRCDMWIMDDVVDDKNSMTDDLRAKIKGLVLGTWLSRLDDVTSDPWAGVCIIDATAWHEDDVNHYLMGEGSGFIFLRMGVSENFNYIDFEIINGGHIFGKEDACFQDEEYFRGRTQGVLPLWEKKPKEVLIKKCMSDEEGLGQRIFDRCYRNKFVSSAEQILALIINYKDKNLSVNDVLKEESWMAYMGVDLAISKRPGSAFTVLAIGMLDINSGIRYLVDVVRGKFSSPSTAALIIGFGVAYNIEKALVENNAYQQSILEWMEIFQSDLKFVYKTKWDPKERLEEEKRLSDALERKYKDFYSKDKEFTPELWSFVKQNLLSPHAGTVPCGAYTTGKTLADESIGLPAFSAEIQLSRWSIPFKDHTEDDRIQYDKCDICTTTKEMVSYPSGKFKDCVMAMFFLSRAMKMSSAGIRNFEKRK